MSDRLICPHCESDVTSGLMEDVMVDGPNTCMKVKTFCPECDEALWLDVDIYVAISDQPPIASGERGTP